MNKSIEKTEEQKMQDAVELRNRVRAAIGAALPESFEGNILLLALCEVYHSFLQKVCVEHPEDAKELLVVFNTCNEFTKESIENIIKKQEKK